MKILIVDDDLRRAEALTSALVAAGVSTKENVLHRAFLNDAKNLLRTCYVDALVLDVVLPRRQDESPASEHSFEFLQALAKSASLKKPEKIIGLTAQLEDIGRFKQEFEKYCLTVIEANSHSIGWKDKVVSALSYTASSKLARAVEATPCTVLTVHGIRTFGEWQVRLQRLIDHQAPGVAFSSYRYGYFSALAFLLPFLREREAKRLTAYLRDLITIEDGRNLIVCCHSFGTFLVATALKKLAAEGRYFPIKILLLCGSVLPNDFDWGFLQRTTDVVIVNDCADRDYVLWMSEALVLGTGMAGKSGFFGMQNDRLVNRFFQGGHSSYFADSFMQKYWVPLLNTEERVLPVDERRVSPLVHGTFEKLVVGLGRVKELLYLGGASALLYIGIGWLRT